MSTPLYDFAAVGIGPFNLGLACLSAPIPNLNGIFFDQRPQFNWHPGLMFEDARLQTPFMSDLVTMADPASAFSFLNYSKQIGKLYAFYVRENFFLLRTEYNQYCQWASAQLPNLHFNTQVIAIDYDSQQRCYRLHTRKPNSGDTHSYRARKLVLGTGPQPYVPQGCRRWLNPSAAYPVLHASDYLPYKASIAKQRSITLVGSGQSAAEIMLDLLQTIEQQGYELNWITRSSRYFPLDYTKLSLEMTSPDYIDYFYSLPAAQRAALACEHAHLAKGINSDTINSIFELIYRKRLRHRIRVNLLTHVELQSLQQHPKGGYRLHCHQHQQDQQFYQDSQAVILATGYQYVIPDCIQGIGSRIRWDDQGRYAVSRYYTIDHEDQEIFVQNAEYHTHGFAAPDLGMACYRNAHIIRQLLGYEYYPIERRTMVQTFAAPSKRSPLLPAQEPA